MNILARLIQSGVIAGFLITASGCIIAPEGDRGEGRDMHHEHHCDEHDDHCRDR